MNLNKLNSLDRQHQKLIEAGVKGLILNPGYKAFQIVMTGLLTYSVFMCTSERPKHRYGKLDGLGYKGSTGHDVYTLVEWGQKLLLFQEFYEEDAPAGHYYYSADQRQKLRRMLKAKKAGKTVVFTKFEKRQFAWDNHSEPLAMVRKGGPTVIASLPVSEKKRIIAVEHQILKAKMAKLNLSRIKPETDQAPDQTLLIFG